LSFLDPCSTAIRRLLRETGRQVVDLHSGTDAEGSRMRVLMSACPLRSHFYPMIPLAWALQVAGHEVLVVAPPNATGLLHEAGISTMALDDDFDPLVEVRAALPAQLLPVPGTRKWNNAFWSMGVQAAVGRADQIVDEYVALATGWGAQLIIADPLELAGRVTAAALGIPFIRHRWAVDPLTGPFEERIADLLAPVHRRFGVGEPPDPAVVVDMSPPGLQLPEAPRGEPVRFMSYSGAATLPRWVTAPRHSRRICVTVGSSGMFGGPASLLHRVLHAMVDLPDTEIVVTESEVDTALAAELGDRLRLTGVLPLTLFLGTCTAIVHHSGSGTAYTAATLGVPQLALPQLNDNFQVAERLCASGVGLALTTKATQQTPAIRDALHTVLTDSGIRAEAGRMAGAVAAMPTPDQFVADLPRLLSAGRHH
jgi:UDP:flavonoid glycosyltransferase YjiC (YdhE family)